MSASATVFVIDGYNLLHRCRRRDIEELGLEGARAELERRLLRFATKSKGRRRVILVYDGASGVAGSTRLRGPLEVLYARPPRSADDVVLAVCREIEGRARVVAVTSDRTDIANRLRGLRVSWLRSEEFAELLEPEVQEERPQDPGEAEVDGWLRAFGMHPEEDAL